MKKFIIFLFFLSSLNLAYAENHSTAKVSVNVVSLNSINIRKQENTLDKNIEVLSKYENEVCPTKFFVKITKNNITTQSETFGTCSDIARIKITENKVLISMPSSDGSYVTYIYDTIKLKLENK
jgi:hypothetical protein